MSAKMPFVQRLDPRPVVEHDPVSTIRSQCVKPRNALLRLAALLLVFGIALNPGSANGQNPNQDRPTHQVRICAGGDVTLGTNLDTTWTATAWSRYGIRLPAYPDPDALLAPIADLIPDADILLLNIEGAIGDAAPSETKCASTASHCFAFQQPLRTADALGRMSGTLRIVGNIANNHSRDAGEKGFTATKTSLSMAGIMVTGSDTLPTIVVTNAGDTVAFLGFHTSRETPDARDLLAVRRYVSRAASQWSRVVVTAHIGAEGIGSQHTKNAVEMFFGNSRGNPVAFARTAIDAGADWVVAHGPHVLRAGEWRKDGLIFYSLGNLLNYGPFLLSEPMNRGAIACISLGETGGPADPRVISTYQDYPGHVRRDNAKRAIALMNSLSAFDFPPTGIFLDSAGNLKRFDQ